MNETGEKAVECAEKLLREAENAIQTVQTFDKNMHTIKVESCAPAPLWTLLPDLTARFHENMISSRLTAIKEIVRHVREGECDIGILPGPLKAYENAECEMQEEKAEKDLVDVSYLREKLNVCIPKDHELAEKEELTMAQINGFNCLLRDQIGFWTDLCHEKMPSSEALADAQIALHAAARNYRTEQDAVTFGLYAKICVCRHLASAVRKEQAKTHSLDSLDAEKVAVPDGIEASLLRDEAYSALLRRIKDLSSAYEYRVFLLLCIRGYSVSQTAKMLGKDEKSVGNARDRLFRRLRMHKELLQNEND